MEASGKKTVLVRKEVPGFIVNRLMGALEREIDYLLDNGVVHPRGPGYRGEEQYRFPVRLSGPHGSGGHDRP